MIANDERVLNGPGVNVPLIVRWPGKVKAADASNVLLSGEDIAPTLLEAAGLKPHPRMSGVSFLPLLKGEPYKGRKHVFFGDAAATVNPPLGIPE